jgi:hypothetical protein
VTRGDVLVVIPLFSQRTLQSMPLGQHHQAERNSLTRLASGSRIGIIVILCCVDPISLALSWFLCLDSSREWSLLAIDCIAAVLARFHGASSFARELICDRLGRRRSKTPRERHSDPTLVILAWRGSFPWPSHELALLALALALKARHVVPTWRRR